MQDHSFVNHDLRVFWSKWLECLGWRKRPGWGASGNNGRELTLGCYALKHKYHLPCPPPPVAIFFVHIHTAKMSIVMRGSFQAIYVGVRVPPSPSAGPRPPLPRPSPALNLAGKWEGVGVWPVAPPPPPQPCGLATIDDARYIIHDEVVLKSGVREAAYLSFDLFKDCDLSEKIAAVLYGGCPNGVLVVEMT